jgi:hypothetical protein
MYPRKDEETATATEARANNKHKRKRKRMAAFSVEAAVLWTRLTKSEKLSTASSMALVTL